MINRPHPTPKTSSLVHLAIAVLTSLLTISNAAPGPEAKEKELPDTSAKPASFRFLGGDSDRGQVVFTQMDCVQCHSVKGSEVSQPDKARLQLQLGEEMRFVKRYEDLITAITNPRHVMNDQYRALLEQTPGGTDVEPFMPKFTESMTVQQLIDLVEFLDVSYQSQLPGYEG